MKTESLNKFFKPLLIFIGIFAGVFIFTYGVLYFLGAIPDEFRFSASNLTPIDRIESLKNGEQGLNPEVPNYNSAEINVKPNKIVIPTIGTNFVIENPSSTNIQILDEALKRGAVRYPTSGTPDQGNMLLFGHSTSFKIVNNKAYQVFNGLSSLKNGDEIYVLTDTTRYVYSVNNVKLVDSRTALVQFTNDKHMLTLSTCNSFGEETDRYKVEADFVRSERV